MKRLMVLLAVLSAIFSACTQFDDSELQDRLEQMEGQVLKLEELCRQMNTNISSLQSLVSALENQDYITDVSPLVKDGVEIGYKIKFVKSPSIIIYHGGDGSDGESGNVPTIGVRQDSDGIYYWTIDGEWLLDKDGKKVKAVGKDAENVEDMPEVDEEDIIIPEMRVEDGCWYVSYDKGLTWEKVGRADGGVFKEIKAAGSDVVFTLFDDTEIVIRKAQPLSITFKEGDLLVMTENSTRDINYSVSGNIDEVNVDILTSGHVKARVIFDGSEGCIQVMTGDVVDEYSKVVLFISDGYRTIVRTLLFEDARIEVVDGSVKQIGDEGGDLTLEYASNVPCEVVVPDDVSWISVVSTKAMEEHSVVVRVAPNYGKFRSAEVVIRFDEGTETVFTIKQGDPFIEEQREILIEFYKATNGDNWNVKHNWCSDKPLSQWYGVMCDSKGYVTSLTLRSNNLLGDFSECIGKLSKLESIDFDDNTLMGSIPASLFSLKNLKALNLQRNPLTGDFPVEIGNLESLETLVIGLTDISGSLPSSISNLKNIKYVYLAGNNLSGSIPPEVSVLMDAPYFRIEGNYFTGKIPDEVLNHPNWKYYWTTILDQQTELDISGIKIPAPEFRMNDIDGNFIDSKEVYANNNYTVLYWLPASYIDTEERVAGNLRDRYEEYQSKGVEVISYSDSDDLGNVLHLFAKLDIPWRHIGVNLYPSMPWIPFFLVVDRNENIVYYGPGEREFYEAFDKLVGATEMYESTDYSRDGRVRQLQVAGQGKGINIVIMGDAYSDRLLADGTYDRDINRAYEAFFSEEPYKSFKDFFNVYQVDVVSRNEVYWTGASTALGTWFGSGTLVGGNDQAVYSYANKAVAAELVNDAMAVVVMNKDAYAGTCYMYDASKGDYGDGAAVAYFPASSDVETFAALMHHEAGGHGFAKLADEYVDNKSQIPQSEIDAVLKRAVYGWWKNVDFTSDLSSVKWSHFISDDRYADEGLGAFEGGLTYKLGVWRPTENSIMRYNTGGFNAPSREAIYYRIHKLAFGESWEYDYEEFVEYDAINRNKTTKSANYVELPNNLEPLAAPVVYNHSWSEAVNMNNKN